MKFVYYVFGVSKLISICIVLDVITIHVLSFDFVLKSLAIASRV